MSKKLYAEVTNLDSDQLISISLDTGHEAAVAMANINCRSPGLQIGDEIEISLGYEDDYGKVFTGYVKQIEKKVPDNMYSVTAQDVLTRAVDYFVASSSPDNPFKRRNIRAEDLVEDVLRLAGLTDFNMQPTYFTLAIGVDAEVNLVSAYDYCNSIVDLIAWHLYADIDGQVNFVNRKPYVMTGTSGQVGDVADTSILTLTDADILNITRIVHERDLRNRIVIYGNENLHAEASSSTSYDPYYGTTYQVLPSGFYKTVVFASPLITRQNLAQQACNYNLNMLNRLNYELNLNVLGNHELYARRVITVTEPHVSATGMWYIYASTLNWSNSGFTCNLVLRK